MSRPLAVAPSSYLTGQIAPQGKKPRVTTTLWEDEGCMCFLVEVEGFCVARRDDNHMINGTKLLSVAGIIRGQRYVTLNNQPVKLNHVVETGPMHLTGVWIPFEQALEFANTENITENLYPLFMYNIDALLSHPINQSRASTVLATTRRPRSPPKSVPAPDYAFGSSGGSKTFLKHTSIHSPLMSQFQHFSGSVATDTEERLDYIPLQQNLSRPAVLRSYTIDDKLKFSCSRDSSPSSEMRPALDMSHLFPTPPASAEILNSEPNIEGNVCNMSGEITYTEAQSFHPPITMTPASPPPSPPFPETTTLSELMCQGLECLNPTTQEYHSLRPMSSDSYNVSSASASRASSSGKNEPKNDALSVYHTDYSFSPGRDLEKMMKIAKQRQVLATIDDVHMRECTKRLSTSEQSQTSSIVVPDGRFVDIVPKGAMGPIANSTIVPKDQSRDQSPECGRMLERLSNLSSGDGGSDTASASSLRSDFSEESIVQSEFGDDIALSSPEEDPELTLAFAKHQMIDSLMQDVYVMFDPQWNAKTRSHTTSQSDSANTQSRRSETAGQSSTKKGKRRMQDRDSPPPDDNDRKRREGNKKASSLGGKDRSALLACPFHKNDPLKYRANHESGIDFRSCAGPGFQTISRLKQHLRRKHEASIDCQRCWGRMSSVEELEHHLLADMRCEIRQRPQQGLPIEGIDREKMLLINSSHGVSWEVIYRILFPGAPVPSSYYETCDDSTENSETSSPQSQELRNFEVYQRTELPMFVETEIRNIINTELAPIEATLRTQLEDIVRRCLSRVAENFQLSNVPPSASPSLPVPPPQGDRDGPSAEHPHMADTTSAALDFFQEPPHLDADASASAPGPAYPTSYDTAPGGFSDSGYISSSSNCCQCSCHTIADSYIPIFDNSSCADCVMFHLEAWGLTFDSTDFPPT